MRIMTDQTEEQFRCSLVEAERAPKTIEKYLRDVRAFRRWAGKEEVTKETVLAYKAFIQTGYATASVNSMLSSLNTCFACLGWNELRVRTLKLQRKTYLSSEKELTVGEYRRLLDAARARGSVRMWLLMQTICSTGIRVSELPFITAEAVGRGYADISCKGKRRRVYIPDELLPMLESFAAAQGIKKGPLFVTQTGRPMDRTNIWYGMKRLCRAAGVNEAKVFPHNLRHLFADTHYRKYKDIVRLADLLGHASINTTRIYTMESGDVHRDQVRGLGLVKTT